MDTNYEHLLPTQVVQSIIDCKKICCCDNWVPAAVFLGGGQPRLRRTVGISVAPQLESTFNEDVRDNTAKRWNGVAAWGTTQSDANNHHRYLVSRKTTAPTGAPRGTPPTTSAHLRTAPGAMGTVGPERDSQVCAIIIRS